MLGWALGLIENSPSSPVLLLAGRRGQVCRWREPRELRRVGAAAPAVPSAE